MSLLFVLCLLSSAFIKSAERSAFSIQHFQDKFLKAINNEDELIVLGVLTSDNPHALAFVDSNSLAKKLFSILMGTATQEDFTNEARQIPFEKIKYMAEQMAKTGGNTVFLNNMRL